MDATTIKKLIKLGTIDKEDLLKALQVVASYGVHSTLINVEGTGNKIEAFELYNSAIGKMEEATHAAGKLLVELEDLNV